MSQVNYLFPHQGLGDYLITHGLIRTLIKPNEEYILFVNKKYKVSVPFMFRDIPNLSYQEIPSAFYNRYTIMPYIRNNPHKLIVIGYDQLNPALNFEKAFYAQFNVPFENKWSKFHVEKDLEREKKLFSVFDIKEGNYIFLHEDVARNQIIKEKYLNSETRIVKVNPRLTDNIFDYCYLIEHAKEVHCIESSFMYLTDLMPTTGKLFTHRYTKGTAGGTLPILKKYWITYDV